MTKDELQGRLKKIKLLILDVDGVMTDGRIIMDSDGREMKNFNVRDGHGLIMARRYGIEVAILSGRSSLVVDHRARDLNITEVHQGALNKNEVYEKILAHRDLTPDDTAFVGDDIVDVPVLKRVGFAVAVADALEVVKQAAHYVTVCRGGHGAVREICDMLLEAQGFLPEIEKRYHLK